MTEGIRRPAVRDAIKRTVDIAIGGAVTLVTLPLFAVIAVAIKLDSRGPVFFRCRRVGRSGREFGMYKFRKMVDGAAGPPLTAADDVRFTRAGRWLSRSKLDELPQLWNVLRGEMSLVGPRPEDRSFVDLWSNDHPEILEVRPGITGLAQLAFAHESTILDQDDRVSDYIHRLLPLKVSLDVLYVTRRSLTMDLRILVWTGVAVFLGDEVAVHRETARPGLRRRPPADGRDTTWHREMDGLEVDP